MDYLDAIGEVLDKAAAVRLPGYRIDVVTAARREFTKRGCCKSKLVDSIERILRGCLQQWSAQEKRDIWLSTESGAGRDRDVDGYALSGIEMDLEGELMYHLIEVLSPDSSQRGSDTRE